MKKIFSLIVVAAAVAMVSCNGNANKPAEAEAVETTEAVECCEAAPEAVAETAEVVETPAAEEAAPAATEVVAQ